MDTPKKTLVDILYEETGLKSSTMTKEEFDKLPLNELYVTNQKKKQEQFELLKSLFPDVNQDLIDKKSFKDLYNDYMDYKQEIKVEEIKSDTN